MNYLEEYKKLIKEEEKTLNKLKALNENEYPTNIEKNLIFFDSYVISHSCLGTENFDSIYAEFQEKHKDKKNRLYFSFSSFQGAKFFNEKYSDMDAQWFSLRETINEYFVQKKFITLIESDVSSSIGIDNPSISINILELLLNQHINEFAFLEIIKEMS